MKKQSAYILCIIFSTGLLLNSCKKSEFDSKYYNPESSVTASVATLYAGLFNNAYVTPHYRNLYTFLIPVLGEYTQTAGYVNGNKIYEQPTNYTADKWDNYYTTVMAQYRELEKYYNNLSMPADKQGFQVFLETARIFFYDQTTQMVDLFGDIPYSSAGSLNSSGTISLAKYDSAQTIYKSILTDLDRINYYLDTANINTFYTQQLTAYDFVNGGSLLKWRQYANSLRLRLAMRISYYDEATAKAMVMGMLGNSTLYPMVINASDAIKINVTGTLVSTGNDIQNGFGINPFAPGYMVDSVMRPTNDPRLPVYFTTNAAGNYEGVVNTTNATTVANQQQANFYSRWDSTTFTQNNYFPGLIITAAETNFSIAEAYQRWGTTASAQTAYYNGIDQSILLYFSINNASSYGGFKDPMPSAAAIAAYKATSLVAFGTDLLGNLKKIGMQKWLAFNIIEANQSWAEYRRTKYPVLNFLTDASSLLAPNPPSRLLYPATESALNSVNFEAVKTKNTITTKIFWDVK